MKRLMFGVALASALATVPIAAAPKSQPSIIVNVPPEYATLPTWQPKLGDTITFTTSYPETLNRYWIYVNLLCYQAPGRTLVFAVTLPPDSSFLLGGTNSGWKLYGGSASCIADLFYWSNGFKYTVIASTEFEVAG